MIIAQMNLPKKSWFPLRSSSNRYSVKIHDYTLGGPPKIIAQITLKNISKNPNIDDDPKKLFKVHDCCSDGPPKDIPINLQLYIRWPSKKSLKNRDRYLKKSLNTTIIA